MDRPARRRHPPRRRAGFRNGQSDLAGEAALLLIVALLGEGVASGQTAEARARAVLRMAQRLAAKRPEAKALLDAVAGFIAVAGEARRAPR